MSLYLCIDCGGSKTSAVICDSAGAIKGRALGGPSNFAYLGIEAFSLAVQTAVSNALKTCVSPPSIEPVALPPPRDQPLFAAAWLGVSGADSKAAIDTIAGAMTVLLGVPLGRSLIVANDTHLLAAPLQMHNDVSCAVTCIAGTGGIVVSFTQDPQTGLLNEMGRVGGWGWILGDEGGGYHVGREAVRQIVMRADVRSVEGPNALSGGQDTLEGMVLRQFGLPENDVYELLTAVHLPDPVAGTLPNLQGPAYLSVPREKRLSQLAPLVFKAAFEDNDPLASNVLKVSTSELVSQIAILCGTNKPKGINPSEGVICFGGSLVGVEKYRNMILGQLAEKGIVFKKWEFVDDAAAVGAKGLAAAMSSA